MAMSVGTSSGKAMCEVNMTPLIDVMLVLIVTLIMTLPIQTHAVKLDMPPPTDQPPPPVLPEVINLDVDFDDTVYWDGNKVDLGPARGLLPLSRARRIRSRRSTCALTSARIMTPRPRCWPRRSAMA